MGEEATGKGQVYTQHSGSAGPSYCEVGRGGGLKGLNLPVTKVVCTTVVG